MAKLIGYTDKFSARPGETIGVKVSSKVASPYLADLVRIISADPNPDGPGIKMEAVAAAFAGDYPSHFQPSRPGSYGLIALSDAVKLSPDRTLSIKVQPWLLDDREQVILSLLTGDRSALTVSTGRHGAELRFHDKAVSTGQPMTRKGWYELRLSLSGKEAVLMQIPMSEEGEAVGSGTLALPVVPNAFERIVIAAAPSRTEPDGVYADFFNGRLEDLLILGRRAEEREPFEPMAAKDSPVAWWDFGIGVSTTIIMDVGSAAAHGQLYQLPTRGVRGSRWSGDEMCWRHAPHEYAAIHFHEDDLYDCGWKTSFDFVVPDGLSSGVYGFRLRAESEEDVIPFFVRPQRGGPCSKMAVLFPTMTYQIYANYPRGNYDAEYRARQEAWKAYPNHPEAHPEFGRSTYDSHPDGSGNCYGSSRRPLLTMRPGYIAYVDPHGSGLRHFPADMHLVDWLVKKGIEFDVVTDHDVDREGVAALEGYGLVLTTTHPEYQTRKTLDTLHEYTRSHGSLAYLGGNGFYWKIANSPALPDVLEIRRAESGARSWEADTGEYYNALDGSYGGLWVRNDRPPQTLVGVGMSSQGGFSGSYYRRTPEADDPRVRWVLAGISDSKLGDFGLSGGGAAGFELDCIDPRLGTPPETVVVATSDGHGDDFICVPEKISDMESQSTAYQKSQIRADICIIPKKDGRIVFSVGSITFCGSLAYNGYDNNISRMLENVIRYVTKKSSSGSTE